MKKILRILMFSLLIGAGTAFTPEVKAQSVSVNLSLFQRSLSPYGRWVNHPRFGQIWISNTHGFIPYQTGGHWAYTDYGWTWVSDYDWGWAPFHYGRWGYEPNYGWYWVPAYQWSPAWVAWRSDNDYYGWAPLSPGINVGVSASFNIIPADRWVFAPHRYITSASIGRYYVPRTRNVTIIKNTTYVNNVTVKNNVNYVSGPRVQDVERVNHTKVQTLTVSNSSRAGKTVVNNKTVNIYRPVINNEKVTVNNDNSKTVINKNSNNKTVEKNSNNTTVNKNKTEINKNKTVEKNSNNNNNNKDVNKNNNNKEANKDVHKPQQQKPAQQKPQPQRKPAQHKQPNNNNKKKPHDGAQLNKVKQQAQTHNVAKAKTLNNKPVAQKAKAAKQDVAERKQRNNNNNN